MTGIKPNDLPVLEFMPVLPPQSMQGFEKDFG
jgi:hypothetical protein